MTTPTPEQQLQRAFADLLGATRRRRTQTQGPDLSVAQVRGLVRLSEVEEMTAGELAKASEVTPASVTGMVDTLEREGIVERRRSTTDRRRVVITLTDDGRALIARKRAWWAALWEHALDGLSPDEVAAATVVLERLAVGLSETAT